MTPGNPPRPRIDALPKPMPMETSQATHKHPLPEPAQQGPPNKHARHKAFPYDQQPPATASMPSPSSVEMPRPGTPSPKGPPASFMPTPEDVQQMSSSSPAVDPEDRVSGRGRYRTVRPSTDIGWTRSLSECSLNPISREVQICPSPSKTCCLLRKQIPRLSNSTFNQIYPSDNVIRVVQKRHGVHDVKMREVAAWVLNATHWFNLLKQSTMTVIRCRDWSDASKFQYLIRCYRSSSWITCRSITSLLSRKMMSILYLNTGKSRQLYGMVNRFLASWQRRVSMIYKRLASRTSTQCGHFQRPLSTKYGNL